MTTGQRVLLNTVATYGRSALAIFLGLYSCRWVLQCLGKIDYGLMGVVGGLFGFVAILNGVTSTSCSRYFALAAGKGDEEELNKWFNVAWFIHIALPLLLLCIGLPLGDYIVRNVLVVPAERLATARIVFVLSVATSFVSMIASPYTGMMIARQNIAEMSLWNMAGTICNFIGAYSLFFCPGDKWLVYASVTTVSSIAVTIGQSYRCHKLYSACRVDMAKLFDTSRIVAIFSFSVWQLLASIGGIFRSVCMGMLINRRFPPQHNPDANASYTVGMSIYNYSQVLSGALLGAISPELTSTEGRGDRGRLIENATRASKFAVFLVLVICIPLMLEIHTVLDIWLKDPPAAAWLFAICWMCVAIVDNLTYGQMACVFAVGKIAAYQCVVSGLSMSALPVAWVMYRCGAGLHAAGTSIVITYTLAMCARVIMCKYLTGYPIMQWFYRVLRPIAFCILLAFSAGYVATFAPIHGTLVGIALTAVVSVSVLCVACWCFLFDKTEKAFVMAQFNSVVMRMRR